MYIEFRLPSGSAGMAAGMTRQAIGSRMKALADKHGFSYTTTLSGYSYYVSLLPETAYSLLALVWDHNGNPWRRYIVHEGKMPEQKPPQWQKELRDRSI